MTTPPRSINRLCFQYVAGADNGRWLELCIAKDDGSLSNDQPYPLASIVETDDHQMWIEIQLPEGLYRVKLEEIERGISEARRGGVFSERRYNEELHPQDGGA